MKYFDKLRNSMTVMLLMVMLFTGNVAFATDYIKEVMVIGHDDEDQFNALQASLVQQGWIAINKDLNAGAGGDYIHLLYKKESSHDINYSYVTGFLITNTHSLAIVYQSRTYYPVPCQGSNSFVESHGDLNNNAGGKYIYLYYTRDNYSNKAVTDVTFNDTQSGAVPLFGSGAGYDLNEDAGGDYIYMHLSTATANPPLSGNGTANNPYVIGSNSDWNIFTMMAQDDQCSNKCFQLNNDIATVTTMVGTSTKPFNGTFDGNGHTITVNIDSSETGTAPFHYINGATIKNLTVQGTVTSSAYHASGLAGSCGGINTINNCDVLTNVYATGYGGGIVGHAGTSTLNLLNSYYGGTISGFTNYAGGLLGWCDSMTLNMTDCQSNGLFSPSSNGKYHPIACKSSASTVTATVEHVYYFNSIVPTATTSYIIPEAQGLPVLYGHGTENEPYILINDNDWQTFTLMVQDDQLSNKWYQMNSDIATVTTMVGTSTKPFNGTFDGNGHTITVNISGSELGTAPFHYINGATIKNLTINGSVSSSARHASGLVGSCGGSNTITGCAVNVNVNGAEYVGGMVGHGGTSTLNIIDSYYTGTISGFTNYAGGILGWCDGMTLNMTNCKFDGSFSPSGNGKYHPIACKSSSSTVNAIADHNYYNNNIMPTATAPYIIPEAQGLPVLYGHGFENNPYLINNENDWQAFTLMVQDDQLSNKWYQLNNDIATVTTMAGTSTQPFSGTFDGNSHTITVNISSSEAGTAPFHYINGATIKNLTVNGSVSSSARHASGLVGSCGGSNTITGCAVNVNVNGAEYVSGMVGHGGTSTLNIIDSYYTGTISGFNHYAGGLLGWCDAMTLNLNNCLFRGSFSPASGGLYHPIACKNDGITVTATVKRAYYLNSTTATAIDNHVIPEAEGISVSTTLIEGTWDYPVTAADGITYYSYLSGIRLPYSYGFENNDLAAEEWTITGGHALRNSSAHSGSYCLEMYGVSYLISPELDGRSATTTVSFYLEDNTPTGYSEFRVGYSSTTEDISSFSWGNTITATKGYSRYEATFPKGTKYIAIKDQKYRLIVDDFSFTICDIPFPFNLAVTNLIDKSAKITWEAPETNSIITGYTYQYKKSSDEDWSSEITVGSDVTSAELTNLSGLTTYLFRVKTLYGSNESLYNDCSFTTAVSLPYDYGFEDGIFGWTRWDINWNYTEIIPYGNHDGSHAFRFFTFTSGEHGPQYLITPLLPGDPITMSFYYYAASHSGGSFFVGYSIGGGHPEQDFTWVSEIYLNDSYITWSKYEHDFPTGTRYIAIKFDNYNRNRVAHELRIDDFTFEKYTTYAAPTNLATSSLTNHSATLTWTNPDNSVIGYKYQSKMRTDTHWSDEILTYSTFVILDNLPINTTYDFRVRAVYDGDNTSNYVTIRFVTEGDTEILPYYHDFETNIGGWRIWNAYRHTGHSGDYIHSGNRSFMFDKGADDDQILISPQLECNSIATFSVYHRTNNYTARFQLGFSKTTKDPSAFTWWASIQESTSEWIRSGYVVPAGTKYVAIKWVGGDKLYIDDIGIEPTTYTAVTGYGESTESDHWVFLASPVVGDIEPMSVGNLIPYTASNYDLYRFNQSAAAEWENYKAHTDGFVFENGLGYLYANKNDRTLIFAGELNYGISKTVNLVYDNNSPHAEVRGWNLVGNPFPVDAYSNKVYYKMNDTGSDIEAVASTATAIPRCTGIMVRATGEDQTVTFTRSGAKSGDKPESKGSLELTLTKGGTRGEDFHDKAIVSFDEGTQLEKFIFNEEHAKLYIPQGNEDYAIAFSNRQGEVPVHFKTNEFGQYTITAVETFPETSLHGVHLIDLIANEDIDLGIENSYTFIGKPSDRRARFKIVFKNVENEGNDIFAYQNGDDIIVSGDGELQIFDVMGRMVMNQHINGVETINKPSQSGIYILRLNGKSQKIVIK